MKHLIDRLSEQEPSPDEHPNGGASNDEDLERLLETLQPNIRVFGCGGCGSNTIARLSSEGLFNREKVRGLAVNTDAQHLLRVNVAEKMLIGRTARGRGLEETPKKESKQHLNLSRCWQGRSRAVTLHSLLLG